LLSLSVLGGGTTAVGAGAGNTATVTFVGTGSLSGPDTSIKNLTEGATNEFIFGPEPELPRSSTVHHVAAADVPQPAGNVVVADGAGPGSFNGISHLDQRTAGGGNQFSLEPPDQGLCVGNRFVVETVNDAVRVFSTAGAPLTPTQTLNGFLGLAPAIVRSQPLVFGPFVSDPKCYFDVQTQRFFLTALAIATDPATGAFQQHTDVFIAVSQTANPTGTWNIFRLDTTDAGHQNCPCLGDQPLIGADANGFYVSTNEFGPIPSFANFNGAQLYAFPKTALERASGGAITGVHIDVGARPTPDPGGIWFSLQPATSPGTTFATANGGTEYLLSSLDFSASLDNRIAVWQLTNTSSLNSATPNIALANVVITSEVYGQPPAAFQRMGETPLGDLVNNPLALLASNDDRMNQVVYAAGNLWSGVNTVVQTPNGPTRVGVAFFVVNPTSSSGAFSPTMARQGYVAVNQQNVLFPSIGVNAAGHGVISFTVVGPDFFPSAAFATVDTLSGAGAVHVSGPGRDPEDGFSGYRAFGGGGTSRWGDYSAAVAAADGTLWVATEYIPKACSSAPQANCRTQLANWGTFVTHVTP
jgi:hypothetical protein